MSPVVDVLAHHALLAGAALALGSAAVTLASALTPRGLERLVAAAPIAVSLAVLWCLALGLAGLGTDSAALTIAAAGTWVATRLAFPRPSVPLGADVSEWWAGLRVAGRAAAGAGAAAIAAYAVFLLRHPELGTDAVNNHLSQVVAWMGNGRPGSSVDLLYGLPFGNYPQATETALAWGTGISHSFVFAGLWSLATLLLLGAAAWLGLRSLGAGRLPAALGIAALCTGPLVVDALRSPGTDLPALAWLVTAVALVVASRERPALLASALLAAGLGMGTKTTVVPLALVAVGAGLWIHRGRLAEHRRALIAAAAGAVVVGGTWYMRNLIGHGSPLWPLVEFPGSDPLPPLIDGLDYSLLDRPRRSLEGKLDHYEDRLAGYLALFALAALVPLVARRRAVVVAGVAATLSVVLWANAPFTGIGDLGLEKLYLSTVRYLLPAAAAGAACLVLAAGTNGRSAGRILGLGGLGVCIVWNLVHTLELGYPSRPSVGTLLLAALTGAAVGALSAWAPAGRRAVQAAGFALVLALVVAGTVATDGYVARHAKVGVAPPPVPYAVAVQELASRDDFRDGDEPVFTAPGMSALLAGDELDHEVELIPRDEPCAEVEARASRGFVVIADIVAPSVPSYTARECFAGRRPLFESGIYRIYKD